MSENDEQRYASYEITFETDYWRLAYTFMVAALTAMWTTFVLQNEAERSMFVMLAIVAAMVSLVMWATKLSLDE
jgi:Ca2+/Na+ antiporter